MTTNISGYRVHVCDFYACMHMHSFSDVVLGEVATSNVGEDVPVGDQHWESFFMRITIVDYVFAPITSSDVIQYIKDLIQEHHETFREVHPLCPVIPNMHYMIHIPEWMER